MNCIEQLPTADAYPNARRAVAFFEEHGFSEDYWRICRTKGFSTQIVVDANIEDARKRNIEFFAELKTDDFRKYVAGKLGAY